MSRTLGRQTGHATRIDAAAAFGLALPLGLVILWVVLRVPLLHDWTHTFRPTLEYDSANAARTLWFTLRPETLDPWQQAWLQSGSGRFLEPPVLQTLTALTYLPDGVERPWTSAIFTSWAWLLAAGLLWDLSRRLVGWSGAWVAFAYFLFAPFALAVSRSFQSDSVALLGLVTTAWFALRVDFLRSRHSVVLMAALAGLAALIKPGPLILPIIGVVLAGASEDGPIWSDPRRRWRLATLIGLVVLPSAAYGMLFLQGQVQAKVVPSLLLTSGYYGGWANNVLHVVGWAAFPAAIVGFAVTPNLRRLGVGFLAGYILTSVAFTWHTMTHDYYQVPLLAFAAVGLAGFAGATLRMLQTARYLNAAAMLVVLLAMGPISYLTVPSDVFPASTAIDVDAQVFAGVGDRLGRGNPVIAYSYNYGFPLMFYSGLLVRAWPTAGDRELQRLGGLDIEDARRLETAVRDDGVRYFIVTDGLRGVDDVLAFLDARAPLVCGTSRIWVYDIGNPADLPSNEHATEAASSC